MNIILLENVKVGDSVVIKNRRFKHIKEILKSKIGDKIKIGVINSFMGIAEIIDIEKEFIKLNIESLNIPSPKKLPITLVMAMVRPKSLKKSLHAAITMGVKEIYIIKTWKVEKSFWSSPILKEKELNKIVIEALEQSKDTVMPKIIVKRRFKPFLEDELIYIVKDKKAILAEPTSNLNINKLKLDKISYPETVLAVGPEGGFIKYEIDKFKDIGFEDFNIGKRILRVEFAIPVLLSKLELLSN